MSIKTKKKLVKQSYYHYLLCFEYKNIAHKMLKKWKPNIQLVIQINPKTEW